MNGKKLLSLCGLKWNPFSPELPSEGLLVTPKIESFVWRVEQLVQEGGFALISGDSGTGKSVALRIVAERLASVRDVVVGHPSYEERLAALRIVDEAAEQDVPNGDRRGEVAGLLHDGAVMQAVVGRSHDDVSEPPELDERPLVCAVPQLSSASFR